MHKEKAVRIGSNLVFINGLFILGYGFLVLLLTEIIAEEHFSQLGVSWELFKASNPEAVMITITMLRIAGLAGVVVGILITHFAGCCFREGKKSAWWVWLFTGAIGWGGLLFMESFLWTPVTTTMALIGFVGFLASIIIPAKAIFLSD